MEGAIIIFIALFVGLAFAVSINFGTELSKLSEWLAFMGMVLLGALLGGIPVVAVVNFIFSVYFGTSVDLYSLAWHDGLRDHDEEMALRKTEAGKYPSLNL